MNLEQLIQQLDQGTEFETLVSESQAGGDSKAIRGRLARLAIGVLKRLGQNPNPDPIIGQFNQLYAAASAPAPAKLDLPGLSAIDQYPYPLAMAWQAVEAESVPFVRLHRSCDAFETLIRFLSTITLCSLDPNTISLDLRRQWVNLMERRHRASGSTCCASRSVGRETINTTRSVNPSPTTCFKIANSTSFAKV